MSGPIVRKYGFPNFDKIFGPKPVLHGVEEEPRDETSPERESAASKAEPSPGRPTEEERPAR